MNSDCAALRVLLRPATRIVLLIRRIGRAQAARRRRRLDAMRFVAQPESGTTRSVTTIALLSLLALFAVHGPSPTGRPGDEDVPTALAPEALGFEKVPQRPPEDVDLAELRQRAQLEACPTSRRPQANPEGPLVGVTVSCLGEPGSVDLGAALAGRTTLVNIWASWCAPCREEIPVLAAYTRAPDAVPVLGLNVHDVPTAALGLLIELGVRYPSVADATENSELAFGAPQVIPVSFVVLPDGSFRRIPPTIFRTVDEVRRAVRRYGQT